MDIRGSIVATSGDFQNGLCINTHPVIPVRAIPSGWTSNMPTNAKRGDEFYHLCSGYMRFKKGSQWERITDPPNQYAILYEDNDFNGEEYTSVDAKVFEHFIFHAASGGSHECDNTEITTSGFNIDLPKCSKYCLARVYYSLSASAPAGVAVHSTAVFKNEDEVPGTRKYFSGTDINTVSVSYTLQLHDGDFISLRHTSSENNKTIKLYSMVFELKPIVHRS